MKSSLLLFLFTFVFSTFSIAQSGYIKGMVSDQKSNETLVGVSIIVDDTSGSTTDINGNYFIKVSFGKHKLNTKFIGYKNQQQTIEIVSTDTIVLNVKLESDSKLLDVVVVSAGKFEQNIGEVTVSMEVIKPRLIENKASQSIESVVEQVPGINIIGGQANIRGGAGYSYGAGSRVLLLVDEMPMLSADANDIKWSFLPIENCEQVEVIKGASSALFGSAAMNGAINFRTTYAKDQPITKIDFYTAMYDKPKRRELVWWTGGNPTSSSVSFSHAQKIKNLDLVLGGNGYTSEGYKQYTSSQRYRVNTNLRYRFKKIQGLAVGVNLNIQQTYGANFILWVNPDSALMPSGGKTSQTQGLRYTFDPYIVYTTKKNAKHTIRTRRYGVNSKSNNDDISTKSYLIYAEYQFQKRFENKLTWTAGLTSIYSKVPGSELYGTHESNNYAIFSQFDKKYKRLNISFGIRAEYFKTDTVETKENVNLFFDPSKPIIKNSPIKPVMRAGLNYQVSDFTFLRTSFGQGYRFPSISERFIKTNSDAVQVYPNDSLGSETGWTAEIGIKQGIAISKWKAFFDFAAFISEYRNMVEFTFGQFGNPATDPQYGVGFQAQNVGNTRIMGFEFSLMGQGKIGNVEVNTLLGYTYIDPRQTDYVDSIDKSKSTRGTNLLKYRYEHSGKLDIEFGYKKVFLGFSMRANSNMENVDSYLEEPYFFPGMKEYRAEHNKGDIVYDSRLSFQIDKKIKISFLVTNLFNREVMGRPADLLGPRNFAIQLNVRL